MQTTCCRIKTLCHVLSFSELTPCLRNFSVSQTHFNFTFRNLLLFSKSRQFFLAYHSVEKNQTFSQLKWKEERARVSMKIPFSIPALKFLSSAVLKWNDMATSNKTNEISGFCGRYFFVELNEAD